MSLDSQVVKAHAAWLEYRTWNPERIVDLLSALADALDEAKSDLVPVAMLETNLPEPRLAGEVGRTTGQLRLMCQAVLDRTYLNIVIDSADSSLVPPRPDLRLKSQPLGVVAVFGASNFPFAFGVAGGDTAAALAAGCAVVIKVNPGHPEVSRLVGKIMINAAHKVGAPEGLISLVEGVEAGLELVKHPLVSAVGFTGSTHGGRALFDAVNSRPNPIPFYGELGGLNPVFVLRSAATENSLVTAEGFLASITMGAGQFCTKPGFLVVDGADEVCSRLSELTKSAGAQKMLNPSGVLRHDESRSELEKTPGLSLIAESDVVGDTPVRIYRIAAADYLKNISSAQREVFGPTAVVIACSTYKELVQVAQTFSGTLTSGVHASDSDTSDISDLVSILEQISGRLVWNQWPTGLAVTWAMQHGGPYPASTNPLFTSVGAKSLLRFRRPIVFQNFPQNRLDPALREGSPALKSARINGQLT